MTPAASYPRGFFDRADPTPDTSFYDQPRLVTHIDAGAIAAVTALYAELGLDGSAPHPVRVLDLMSSWVSHLATPPAELVVLGLNQQELDANPMATERVVQDLNADPSLPFGDAEFDAVLCCVSIDYLTRPVEVLAEAARVLRPGAPVVITFSTGASRPRPSTAGWPPTTPDAQPSSPATCETPAASTSRSCPSVRRGAAIAVIRCTPWWRAQSPPEQHMS